MYIAEAELLSIIKLYKLTQDRVAEAEDKTRKERGQDRTGGLCRTSGNMLACVGLYTPPSSYAPVPANMPRVETHKASDGVKCQRHMYTGAGLGLDQEMIDYCRCIKLQSCRQFERWQSFKNMCIGGCVKHCSFVTMVLKACRLGTSRTPKVGRGRGDSVTSKEQLTLFEICNRGRCTADCLDAGVTRGAGTLDKLQELS